MASHLSIGDFPFPAAKAKHTWSGLTSQVCFILFFIFVRPRPLYRAAVMPS